MSITKDSTTKRLRRTLKELFDAEGKPFTSALTASNVTLADNAGLGSFTNRSCGHAFFVETITVFSNKTCTMIVQLPDLFYNGTNRNYRVFFPTGGGTIVIPVNALIRPSFYRSNSTSLGTWSVSKVLDGTPSGAYAGAALNGSTIYDDVDLSADKQCLWIGDSITACTSVGVIEKTKSYEWRTREWLRSQGINVRLSNQSMSSTTSSDHERWRAHGQYDYPQLDLIVYSLGVNNVVAPTSVHQVVTTTSGSPTIRNTTGVFTADMIGGTITPSTSSGAPIPAGTTITAIATDGSTATLSANATATVTGAAPGGIEVSFAPLASYTYDLGKLISWKQARYPNAKLLILGSTPLGVTGNETVLATLRAAAASAVTTAADPNIRYQSLATSFDPTDQTNYAQADGGSVHPLAIIHIGKILPVVTGALQSAITAGWSI